MAQTRAALRSDILQMVTKLEVDDRVLESFGRLIPACQGLPAGKPRSFRLP